MTDHCRYRHTDRTGLYVMVFFILVAVWDVQGIVKEIRNDVGSCDEQVEEQLKE